MSARPRRRDWLSNLRVGSQLITPRGVTFQIMAPVVLVAAEGAESPSLVVERTAAGQTVTLVLTLSRLASQIGRATHRRGDGPRIDWAGVPRRSYAAGFRTAVAVPVTRDPAWLRARPFGSR